MVKSVRITPDGEIAEVSEEQEREEKQGRNWDGSAMLVPEVWKHKKFRLTLTFPDMFHETDQLNPLATMLFRRLRNPRGIPEDVLCGTVYISNEKRDKLLDFTLEHLKYIMQKAF